MWNSHCCLVNQIKQSLQQLSETAVYDNLRSITSSRLLVHLHPIVMMIFVTERKAHHTKHWWPLREHLAVKTHGIKRGPPIYCFNNGSVSPAGNRQLIWVIPMDRVPAVCYDWLACGMLLSCRRWRMRQIAVIKRVSTFACWVIWRSVFLFWNWKFS